MPEGRNEQGRFVAGVSGNPRGMAAADSAKVYAARTKALAHCPRAIARLNKLMDDPNGKVAVMAAMALLRVGGVLSTEADVARIEREVEKRLRELIEAAEAERMPPTPAGPPMLEAVK